MFSKISRELVSLGGHKLALESCQKVHSPTPNSSSYSHYAYSPTNKANVFTLHLTEVFKPHCLSSNLEEAEILDYIQSLFPIISFPIVPFTTAVVRNMAQLQKPGHDRLSNKAIKVLSKKGITFFTLIFIAILCLGYYPKSWKLITLIYKPGKPIHGANSYSPISLLPNISKLFEKLLIKRLHPTLEELKIIPDH